MRDDAGTIVVGGGHAGVEAALASARLGVPTLLVTGDPEKICTLPCNPSIGGSAKGQLVREIDALGGAMGGIADRCSLHARFLNESKGPAVRALRQQMDKPSYAACAPSNSLPAQPNLTIVRGLVEDLDRRGRRGPRRALRRRPASLRAAASFLRPERFWAESPSAATSSGPKGVSARRPQSGLAAALRRLGFPTARLKTGTPPRIDKPSVDYGAMLLSAAESAAAALLVRERARFAGPQLPCYVTETNARTHALVRENLHRSPLYGLDLIRGIGPRYCPSIEDKVVKFAHNPTHQIFIEPEGWDEPTLYVGGFSTSLPAEIQLEMLQTLPGSRIVRDAARRLRRRVRHGPADRTARHARNPPRRAASTTADSSTARRATKRPPRRACSPGINAARGARGEEPLRLTRAQGYIGVLDRRSRDQRRRRTLSHAHLARRASRRAAARQRRSSPHAGRPALGLVDDVRLGGFRTAPRRVTHGARMRRRNPPGALMRSTTSALTPAPCSPTRLRRPRLGFESIAGRFDPPLEPEIGERVAIEIKCEGYVRREEMAIEKAAKAERVDDSRRFRLRIDPRALARSARKVRHPPPPHARDGRADSRHHAL